MKLLLFLFSLSIVFSEYAMEKAFVPCSIANVGNTCYINAALQMLCSVQPLTYFILKQKNTEYFLRTHKNQPTLVALYMELLERMGMERVIGAQEIEPFCNKAQNLFKFEPKVPQDAGEFLQLFLDQIGDNEVNRAVVKKTYHKTNKVISEPSKLFHVRLSTLRKCLTCSHERWKATYELMLTVEIKGNTLLDCLKNYFTAEENIPDYQCNRCSEKVPATQRYYLTGAPEYLIIVLKRYIYAGTVKQKIHDQVAFPIKGLDLECYFPLDKQKGPVVYDLCSLLAHSGEYGGGHYTAYVNTKEDIWYYCNDEHVSLFEEIQQFEQYGVYCARHTETPYILLYKKRRL